MSSRVPERPWWEFVEWCKARRLKALPAHPWTVAAYARWCETRYRYPGIAKRVRLIARAHLLRCATPPDRHPIVIRTLKLIEQRQAFRGKRPSLFRAQDFIGDLDRDIGRALAGAKPHVARKRMLRNKPRLVSRRPNGG